jgi:hypothetical protein
MLYILLIIIAVGVLLASEDGKELLGSIIKLLLIGGGLYIAFWIVMLAIGLLSDKETRDSITTVAGTLFLAIGVIYYIYTFYKKYQKGDFKKEIIKSKLKNVWLKNWNAGIGSKIAMIFIILSFSTIAVLLIWSFTINGFWQ